MIKLYGKFIDLFLDFSPEREQKKRLDAARLLLVEHECQLEYYTASTTMLKERIARLSAEVKSTSTTSTPPQRLVTPHHAFSFKRAQQ